MQIIYIYCANTLKYIRISFLVLFWYATGKLWQFASLSWFHDEYFRNIYISAAVFVISFCFSARLSNSRFKLNDVENFPTHKHTHTHTYAYTTAKQVTHTYKHTQASGVRKSGRKGSKPLMNCINKSKKDSQPLVCVCRFVRVRHGIIIFYAWFPGTYHLKCLQPGDT